MDTTPTTFTDNECPQNPPPPAYTLPNASSATEPPCDAGAPFGKPARRKTAALKPPSFPCYVNNIFGSGRIAAMSNAEFGAYWMLLCRAWNEDDCGLPNDDDILASWSRAHSDWPNIKAKILKCFHVENGRLYNHRLLHCRRALDAYSQVQSQKGKQGNIRRWGNRS